MTSADQPKSARGAKARMIQMAVGMVAGAAAAGLGLTAAEAGIFDLASLSWSEIFALVLSLMLTISGLFVLISSFSAKGAASVLDPSGQAPPRPGQTIFLRQQGVVVLLAGIMMAIPVLAPLLVGTPAPPLAMALMMALVALFLVQTALNLSVWTRADEMMRQMIAEAGAVCFWVLQGSLFLWAAAEQLGLAPAISAWDATVILMAFYLLVSSVLSVRRGFA